MHLRNSWDAVHIGLAHVPGAVGSIGRCGWNRLIRFLTA